VQTHAQARLKKLLVNSTYDTEQHTVVQPSTQNLKNFEQEIELWFGKLLVHNDIGDIDKQQIQAIGNPANSHLNHFGGVDREIADAAGNELV